MLEEYFAVHPLGEVRYVPQFPLYTDRAAWEGVAHADREVLLSYAEKWHGRPWPVLTAGMYASYIRTGSRSDCEQPYFERRRRLCSAVLHVCLTGTEDYLPDVEDGVVLICEETAWAISAHANLSREHPFPEERANIVDIFAAQTAMILSFTAQLLTGVLHPDLIRRIRREVERRVLRPFMENDGEWWMGFTRKDLNNWTPWIISNILMAANVWHFGGAALIERACGMLERWLACVPEDGGCDEGAGYWNMAGGAFLDCLMALESMAGVDLWQEEKVCRMMAYPELVYLGNGWFANFADCDARPYISGERLQYAGIRTGNAALVRMGTEMWGSPLKELSDTPHLSRVLMRIFSKPPETEAADVPRIEGRTKDVWLPDLQVRLLEGRDCCGSADGAREMRMLAAMKGGHNDENHNHNDVGSFLIMANGDMQVVDVGNMVYTAKTFSADRYELWNCRGAYHNVPIIGGMEQHDGAAYAAKDVVCLPEGMALDMAGAYPGEAGVQICRRTFQLSGVRLSIRDEITLAEERPVTWVFMLRHEPVIDSERQCCHLKGSGCWIDWSENTPLTAAVEAIDVTDSRMAKSYPGKLWRLMLMAAPAKHHTQEFLFEA